MLTSNEQNHVSIEFNTQEKPQKVASIKLQFSLSVCTPPFFRHDRRTATKFGTHSGRYGTHSELKKITHPTPEGCHVGVGGSKNQKSGKCELPRKSIKKKLKPGGGGVGWKF